MILPVCLFYRDTDDVDFRNKRWDRRKDFVFRATFKEKVDFYLKGEESRMKNIYLKLQNKLFYF